MGRIDVEHIKQECGTYTIRFKSQDFSWAYVSSFAGNYFSRIGGVWERYGFSVNKAFGKITVNYMNIVFPEENVDHNEFQKKLTLVFKEYMAHCDTRIELRKKRVVDFYALRNGDFCKINKAQRRKGLSVALQFQGLVAFRMGRVP